MTPILMHKLWVPVLGAINGKEIWPNEMQKTVNDRMKEHFGQNIDDWMHQIEKYGK